MKIAIISAGVLPIPAVKGGAVETLIEYFLNQNEVYNDYNITVYTINDDKITENDINKYKNVKFEFINVKKENKIFNLLKRVSRKIFKLQINDYYINQICKDIKLKEYDYIMIENRSQYVIPVSKFTKDNILLHIHNDYLNEKTKDGKEILDKCDKILTVSQYIKNRVKTLSNSDKVYVWENCVDVPYFEKNSTKENRELWRKKYDINEDEVVILFSGRLVKEKGIKELLLAVRKLNPTLKFKVCIVGASWYSNGNKNDFIEELKNIVKSIEDKVIFTGYIPFNEMCYIYNMADIAVMPSIWEEPAGLVFIESMVCGLPIITTYSGGISEYINDKCSIQIKRDNSLIDNLSKNIENLIIDKDLRLNMGIEAKKQGRKFNTLKYYEDFYKIIGKDK